MQKSNTHPKLRRGYSAAFRACLLAAEAAATTCDMRTCFACLKFTRRTFRRRCRRRTWVWDHPKPHASQEPAPLKKTSGFQHTPQNASTKMSGRLYRSAKKRTTALPSAAIASCMMPRFTKASLSTFAPKMPFTNSTFSCRDSNRYSSGSKRKRLLSSAKGMPITLKAVRNSYVRQCQAIMAESLLST